jgi:hypothetical protein
MLTLDLHRFTDVVRDAPDALTAQRLAALLEADPRVQKRVRQIAAQEAERLAGAPVHARAVEVRVRTEDATVYIDVDVESPPAAK